MIPRKPPPPAADPAMAGNFFFSRLIPAFVWFSWIGLLGISAFELSACGQDSNENLAAQHEFFERYVRPLLIDKCSECHGAETQWNGLRVDSLDGLLKGGDQGPAIVPGKAKESRLIKAVLRTGSAPMPPDDPLNAEQIDRLVQWIDAGAVWPESPGDPPKLADADKSHWAFQPIHNPSLPENRWPQWARNEIDLFVAEKLDAKGLSPTPDASPQALLRRMSFDVTGLPPSVHDVRTTVSLAARAERNGWADSWTDTLLASPAYGEHWGRLWMDIARFSDTKGYVYAREEKQFIHAHVYRDWVIDALRRDLPYDRFIKLQLAADMMTEAGDPDRAAMGFLTLGRRFIGVSHDIIDDRIDVVTRGLMGLTVACARCHDHKYDPIPTADYYSLYSVFLNSTESREMLCESPSQENESAVAWHAELKKREVAFEQAMLAARKTASERMRAKMVDYFVAQTELEKYPQEGFDQILSVDDLIPNLVRRLDAALAKAKHTGDARFSVWHRFSLLAKEEFETQAKQVWEEIASAANGVYHPITNQLFDSPPKSQREVAEAYAKLIAGDGKEAFKDFLEGPDAPFDIPNELMYGIEGLFDSNTCNELWKLQNEIDRWILQSNERARFAVTMRDREGDYAARVFHRGNPARRGDVVERRMLRIVAEDDLTFADGKDRLQLADQIASARNPLTARIWVNRIWKQYFGEGLVRTTSDFGLRAEPPTHPELLDWLTTRFIEANWSTKAVHRLILGSATYRQGSLANQSPEVRARGLKVDPENRLLWHMPTKRLTFEGMRDSMLAASGELSHGISDRHGDLFPAESKPKVRTIYCSVDRQFVPSVLRVFDYANPDMHSPKRNQTLVPQQALFSLNHPFVVQRAKRLVESLTGNGNDDKLEELFLRVVQRLPTVTESKAMLSFLNTSPTEPALSTPVATEVWSYGTAKLDITEAATEPEGEAQVGTVTLRELEQFPHFNGTAWQGSENFPDERWGWAQLTATGGHPGNDLSRAVVRRWTAPRKMKISIDSKLVHEETPGDGIRASVVGNRLGCLVSERAHNSRWEWNSDVIDVEAGDRLDFVVDIYQVLNTDQYLWHVIINEVGDTEGSTQDPKEWDSQRDFFGPALQTMSAWEQLAQVLLISNEATFIE